MSDTTIDGMAVSGTGNTSPQLQAQAQALPPDSMSLPSPTPTLANSPVRVEGEREFELKDHNTDAASPTATATATNSPVRGEREREFKLQNQASEAATRTPKSTSLNLTSSTPNPNTIRRNRSTLFQQPSGQDLQAIPKHSILESGADYTAILNELQIKPEYHDEVVTGILQVIRMKKGKNLKTATPAMLRDLSATFVRGYGAILYKKETQKWLVDVEELKAQGKKRIAFTQGDVRIDGPNAHFFTILEPLWCIMRGIVFELKATPKKRGRKGMEEGEQGDEMEIDGDGDEQMVLQSETKIGEVTNPRGRPRKASAQAAKAPLTFEQKQENALELIEKEIEKSKANGTWESKYGMSTDETYDAVQDLIVKLHEIRSKSEPKVFEEAWNTNMGRLDDVETISEFMSKAREPVEEEEIVGEKFLPANTSGLGERSPIEKAKLSDTAPVEALPTHMPAMKENNPSERVKPSDPAPFQKAKTLSMVAGVHPPGMTAADRNLCNKPWNTTGNPSYLFQLDPNQKPPIPSAMSVYICTDPGVSVCKEQAYHWPGAPIGVADCKRLFDGIDMRVEVYTITGYTFSYGWNDIMRAVDATDQGKGRAFKVMMDDIALAASLGVTRWRMKVLVRGVARAYLPRV